VQRTFGKRLDYIFHRAPTLPSRYSNALACSSSSSADLAPALSCIESEVVLDALVPGQDYSYSDHFGLRAKFAITSPAAVQASSSVEPTLYDPESDHTLPIDKPTGSEVTPVSSGGSASSSTPLRTLVSLSQTQQTLSKYHTLVRHHRKVHLPHARSTLYLVPWSVPSPLQRYMVQRDCISRLTT
jgi:sphingomyelin phosphodiesterase 2